MKLFLILLMIFAYQQDLSGHQASDACVVRTRAPVNKATEDLDRIMCRLSSRGAPALYESRSEVKYYIKHTGNEVLIDLNLKFDQAGSAPKRNYHNYVNQCLELYKSFLKGPEGETLSIRVGNKEYPPPTVIDILPKGTRAHSEGYSEDIDCPTVLHEVLHLLGLADEYPEKTSGFIADRETGEVTFVEENPEFEGYDCRAVTVRESIMYNHWEAVQAVLVPNRSKQLTCVCEGRSGKRVCERLKKHKNPAQILSARKCPRGTTSRSITEEKYSPQDLLTYLGVTPNSPGKDDSSAPTQIAFQTMEGDVEAFTLAPFYDGKAKPMRESLLMPAHFRAIVYPLCESENKKYRECTEEAYQHSEVQECSQKAKECQSNLDWLL